jgi:hypothetical protein
MSRFNLHTAVLLLVAACIGGLAFVETIRPGNLFDLVRMFSMC